jgi:hypothetical protein
MVLRLCYGNVWCFYIMAGWSSLPLIQCPTSISSIAAQQRLNFLVECDIQVLPYIHKIFFKQDRVELSQVHYCTAQIPDSFVLCQVSPTGLMIQKKPKDMHSIATMA